MKTAIEAAEAVYRCHVGQLYEHLDTRCGAMADVCGHLRAVLSGPGVPAELRAQLAEMHTRLSSALGIPDL